MEARRLVNAYPEGCGRLLERGSPKLSYAELIPRIHTGGGGVIRAETTLYPEVIPTVIHKSLGERGSDCWVREVNLFRTGEDGCLYGGAGGQTVGLILPRHYKEGGVPESTSLESLCGL